MKRAQPRRLLSAHDDVKVSYERMLFEEFGNSGFLSGEMLGKDSREARQALLLVFCVVRHVNGRDGFSHVGMQSIATHLGYNTNDHPFYKGLRAALVAGILTQDGKVGRAPKLRLSLPEALRDRYDHLAENTLGDVITLTDIKAKAAPSAGRPGAPFVDPFKDHTPPPYQPVIPRCSGD